jgi:hypothetical protein
LVCIGLLAAVALTGGCDETTAPPRVMVPAQGSFYRLHEYPTDKPLPPEIDSQLPPPPFNDQPIVTQQLPEETAFIQQYLRVGQPRFVVFVNRDLYGQEILPPGQAIVPGTYVTREQLDQIQAAQVGYATIETMLADWLASEGKVHVVSPSAVHSLLSAQQIQSLQSGHSDAAGPVGQTLSADVLVQVQAHPIEQTAAGLKLRLIAEAMNTRDGASIGRVVIDVNPPQDDPHIREFTRFVARKLMDEMTLTWQNYTPSPAGSASNQPPALVPMAPATPASSSPQPAPTNAGTPVAAPPGAFVEPATPPPAARPQTSPPSTTPSASSDFFGTP